MKIVGITPIKNEQAFIDSFATSITKICDKVIVLDDNSTDITSIWLKKNNATFLLINQSFNFIKIQSSIISRTHQ